MIATEQAVELRPMDLNDIETVAGWVESDPSILPAMRFPEGSTSFSVRNLLLSGQQRPDTFWFIAEREGEPIGAVGATDIKPDGTAHCHILVPREHRGGRTFETVAKAGFDMAFNQFGLQALMGVIVGDNSRAIRVSEHLGFKDLGLKVVQLTRDEYIEREA